MADGTTPTIAPKEAIALGMKYFNELMESQPKSRVLLEGLDLDGKTGNWIVTFGFDSERVVPSRPAPLVEALVKSMEGLRAPQLEIVREFRAVHLSSDDGNFIKLEHA